MSRRKRILLWFIGGIGILFALLMSALLLAPVYLNTPVMREKIETAISRKLGGEVKFQKLAVSLFPRPHAVVRRIVISIPERLTGATESLSVYPRMLPLLKGKLLISEMWARAPDFTVALSEETGKRPGPSLAAVEAKLGATAASLESIAPGLVLRIENGALVLMKSGRTALSLRNVNARFTAPPGEMEISIKADTDRWGAASLNTGFSFDRGSAEVRDLSVSMWHSSLSGLSARISLKEQGHLDIFSGTGAISLADLSQWRSLSGSLSKALKDVNALDGTVTFSSINVSGPLSPAALQINIAGKAENVVVDSKLLPAPLSLNGQYDLESSSLAVAGLSASLNRSSASGISGRFRWGKVPHIEVLSGRALIFLDEVYQWRSWSKGLSKVFKDVKGLTGAVILSSISFSGPPSQPATWRMKLTGEAKKVVVDSRLLPEPLSAGGQFFLENHAITVNNVSASAGSSSLAGVSARYEWKSDTIEVSSGKAVIALGEVYQWRSSIKGLRQVLKDVNGLKGTVRLSSVNIAGPLSRPRAWRIAATGNLENIVLDSPLLPGPAALPQGEFSLAGKRLSFTGVRSVVLDSSFAASGALRGFPESIDATELFLDGNAGREIIEWAFRRFNLPHDFAPAASMDLSRVHLLWQKNAGISLTGNASVMNGPAISIDFDRAPGEIAVRRAAIKDRESNATLSFTRRKTVTAFSFSGSLAQSTLNRIFAGKIFGHGRIQGDVHASIVADRPRDSSAQGNLEGDDIVIPWGLAVPVRVDSFVLHAGGNVLTIDSAAATWGDDHFSLKGDVTASPDGFVVDMNVAADGVNVNEIHQYLAKPGKPEEKREEQQGKETAHLGKPSIRGLVQFESPYVVYGRYMISPVRVVATIGPEGVSAAVTDAKVCGMSVPGTITIGNEEVRLNFTTSSAKQQLESSILCLSGADVRMTGTFDLNAEVSARGKSGALLSSLEGDVDFKAKNGKIYRYPLLAKIFSVLSVTEIFRGKIPELGGNGFAYHSVTVKGKLHNGKLELEKMFLDGSSLDIIAQGDIDIAGKKMDLVVLVAPFSTINWIIRHIPLVGKILGGTFISIPVKVSGDLSNPDVTFLAPSAVGTRILEILKNIVELPIEIISPILPHEKESGK